MTEPKITIAIDGYSSSGKSTMAKKLAAKLGYRYVDTGAMYRSVTLYAMRHGLISDQGVVDEKALQQALPDIHINFAVQPDGSQHTTLNGEDVEADIRRINVSNHVSTIAAIPFVRRAMVSQQQAMGSDKSHGLVMDGRDIGTVVFPNAELKIFVTASPQTRAQRRFAEDMEKGRATSYEEVLANVMHRDHIDETREDSPLRRADDAVLLDNSYMTLEEQDKWLADLYSQRIAAL